MAVKLKTVRLKRTLKSAKTKWVESNTWQKLRVVLGGTWYLLKENWRIVLPFLLVYSVVNLLVTTAAIDLLSWAALRFAGMTYIGPDNIAAFFKTPATNVLVLLGTLVICFLHIVEISAVMHVYSMSNIGKRTTVKGMLSTGIYSGLRAFWPKNWAVLPMMLILVPLTGFFSLSFSSVQAAIPGFVKEFIAANTLYRGLYTLIYLVLLLIEMMYIFAMNFHLLGDESFPKACSKSRKLVSGRFLFTILALLVVVALFSISVTTVSSTAASVMIKAASHFSSEISSADSVRLGMWILNLNGFLAALLAPGVNIAALTALFFEYLEDREMLATLSPKAFHDRILPRRHVALLAAVFVALAAFSIYYDGDAVTRERPETQARPQITAHRGDSIGAPDNSMAAFELAALEHPGWVEFDVQQTKDGVLLVCHDDDLQRVSGRKVFIHDLTYEETREIDVGSWFAPEFSDLRLPTLDEVLKLFKDSGTKVLVEIKHTDYGMQVEEGVLQTINDNDMHEQTVVISTHPGTLERVKELDPSMLTGYSMFVAWADIADVSFSDYFVVEESNIDPWMVDNVHDAGGLIFAWTVNSEETVQYLVDCGVDSIFTDNPTMMKRALDACRYDTGPMRWLRLYLNELRAF